MGMQRQGRSKNVRITSTHRNAITPPHAKRPLLPKKTSHSTKKGMIGIHSLGAIHNPTTYIYYKIFNHIEVTRINLKSLNLMTQFITVHT